MKKFLRSETVSIRLTPDLNTWLKEQGEQEGRSKSSLAFQAIREYVERQQHEADLSRAHAAFARPGILDVTAPHETD